MKTWQFELMVVAIILLFVTILSRGGTVELLGAGAVLLSFAHAQVADRLAEREATRSSFARDYVRSQTSGDVAARWAHNDEQHGVHCYAWARRYLVAKECLWVAYFVIHGSWSALAGCGMFILYPFWRAWWRRQ